MFLKNESKEIDPVIRNLDKYLGDFEDIGLFMGLIKKNQSGNSNLTLIHQEGCLLKSIHLRGLTQNFWQ